MFFFVVELTMVIFMYFKDWCADATLINVLTQENDFLSLLGTTTNLISRQYYTVLLHLAMRVAFATSF